MLATMPELDDDDATRITARLLHQLWRSPEPAAGLIALESWCAVLVALSVGAANGQQ
jgi:streptomycin 6-kinase